MDDGSEEVDKRLAYPGRHCKAFTGVALKGRGVYSCVCYISSWGAMLRVCRRAFAFGREKQFRIRHIMCHHREFGAFGRSA